MDYKSLITNEIKNVKHTIPNSTVSRIFEKACENLKFSIKKCFREDISNIFLYSCQIILDGENMFNGKGKTKEDSYNNAIRSFLENIQEEYFIDEINENIKNFDMCENLILQCKEFFKKYPTKISKFSKFNFETIKNELNGNLSSLSISETYNTIDENKIVCSIYLNKSLLLHQSCGKDKSEAIENAAKEFFTNYSIIQNLDNGQNPKKPEFNLADVLSRLKDHLHENNVTANYFEVIRKFVQNLNYKFEVKFNNEIATAKINGVKVAEAKEKDEYSCYILLCHDLLTKIKKAKPYVPPPPVILQQDIPSSSAVTSIKPRKLKETSIKNSLDLSKKYQKIARDAQKYHDANETSTNWSIVNRLFRQENIPIEPQYKNKDGGIYVCVLMNKDLEIVEGSDESRDLARENAAKLFIDKYLLSCLK